MKKRMRKAVKRKIGSAKAKGAALLNTARKRLEMEVKALVAAGLLTKPDAKKLLNEFMRELNMEKDKFLSFAKKELGGAAKRVHKKAMPVARKAMANYRKVRARKAAASKRRKR